MKVFGYSVIEKETIGYGEFWWNEYHTKTVYKNIKTKLFKSKEERDEKRKEDEKIYLNRIRYDEDVIVLDFESEI